mmetsp:Transcript_20306/g.46919  ORF Transcript_20306/g.46919 Transcript_20306/m.46919 type:complete len:114 (+) Transcript_20306:1-342(+)
MKNLIPHILLILFINLAQSDNAEGEPLFGHYGGYVTWPFQVLGILCVAFAGCLILVGAAMPAVYEPYDIPYRKALAAAQAPQKEVEGMETDEKKDLSSEGEEVASPESTEAEA